MFHRFRIFEAIALALVALGVGCGKKSGAATDPPPTESSAWKPLRIGAGGYLTGLDVSPDGSTMVVRADTYGAYLWNRTRLEWEQLVTASSMPSAEATIGLGEGVYELRVAPSAPTRLYMAYRGYVYRSDDRGGTWARTSFAQATMPPNDGFRMYGQKMAVDPANPDVVYAGTSENGLFVSTDGGGHWSSVAAIPAGDPSGNGHPGITGIAFDPGSGAQGGKTQVIYASSWGRGVYKTSNGGTTWAALSGGPSSVTHGKVAVDGVYYVTGDDGTKVWKYDGAWKDITPAVNQWSTVLTDPFDAARVIAIRAGGYLDISPDRGQTWGGILWGPGYDARVATDIPWLAWTNESYMSEGELTFDPVTPGRIWFSEGIGVWYTDLPASPSAITFYSQSKGIEQLVANQIVSPPGGRPLVSADDRPVFYVDDPDRFPARHGPDNQREILAGWDIDWASSDPRYIAGIFTWDANKSGYSTDGGQTWTPFASAPSASSLMGGCLAVSTPQNIVWVASNNQCAYYTKDGGGSWTQIVLSGVPASGETGWGFAYYLKRHIVAADRVAANTFYLYNYLTGLYRSTDGGDHWSLVHPGELVSWSGYNAKLRSVPGRAGHLFFTAGPQGSPGDPHPAESAFVRSTDGGATWTPVPGVLEVWAFGFGKESATGGYPAIYIAGWVDGVYGIYRSDDEASSWKQVGVYPLGSLDSIVAVEGDANEYGTVYVGFNGSGFAYRKL